MDLGSAEYLAHLQALLPVGAAWSRDRDAVITRVLAVVADELGRVDLRAGQLVREIDPRLAFEMLADWEGVAGLPDGCDLQADTLQGRRLAVHGRVTAIGGQSAAYFVGLAGALGYEVSIGEYRPFRAGWSAAGDALTNETWRHVWRVDGPETTIVDFRAGSSAAGEPLRNWGNEMLECVIRRAAPAHTMVMFTYG